MRRLHQVFDFGSFFKRGSPPARARFTNNLHAISSGGFDGGGLPVANGSVTVRRKA
jgi:hypothetical protein